MLVIKLCIKNEKSCSQHPIVLYLPIECLTSYSQQTGSDASVAVRLFQSAADAPVLPVRCL